MRHTDARISSIFIGRLIRAIPVWTHAFYPEDQARPEDDGGVDRDGLDFLGQQTYKVARPCRPVD